MKLKSILLSSLGLLLSVYLYAQCDKEAIKQKEHAWTKVQDALTANPAQANLGREQQLVKTIAGYITALYPKPKGAEGKWYGYFNGKKIPGQYSDAYTANLQLYKYLCANGKEILSSGYESKVFVNVNHMGDMADIVKVNNKDFWAVRAITETKDGYTYYVFDPYDNIKKAEQWIITYKDKSPFIYVTRKEYLTEIREENSRVLDKMVKEAEEMHKQNPTEFVNQARRIYGRPIAVIDDLLKNQSEEYLSQPAVVMVSNRLNFDGFKVNTNDHNYTYLVRNNPEYFNRQLPVSSPQYLCVLITHPLKGEQDKVFYDAVNTKGLLDSLAALLGK